MCECDGRRNRRTHLLENENASKKDKIVPILKQEKNSDKEQEKSSVIYDEKKKVEKKTLIALLFSVHDLGRLQASLFPFSFSASLHLSGARFVR